MRTLLVSAIITPDGTRLVSAHRHDYRSHVDANGETYSIDGGLDYVRRSLNNIPATDAFVYTDDSHELKREAFTWGTNRTDDNNERIRKKLKDLTDEHIAAILETQYQITDEVRKLFYDEITYRKTSNEKNN
jgi:hypothetical protein